MVNKVLTKPRVRGKTRHKTSLYSKLEKASMLIGTAGLLGGVIGPVIAPAEEVLDAAKLNKVDQVVKLHHFLRKLEEKVLLEVKVEKLLISLILVSIS